MTLNTHVNTCLTAEEQIVLPCFKEHFASWRDPDQKIEKPGTVSPAATFRGFPKPPSALIPYISLCLGCILPCTNICTCPCACSVENPLLPTLPLHAAVALLKINKELLTPPVSRPASLVPTGHAALQHQSHLTCIRHQANGYFTFEADLILPTICLKVESASLVSLNCLL